MYINNVMCMLYSMYLYVLTKLVHISHTMICECVRELENELKERQKVVY